MKGKVKTISLLLVFALLLNIFAPMMKVLAVEFGSGNYELTVEVGTNDLKNGTISSVKVNGETWTNNSDIFKTATGSNNVEVAIEAEDGYAIGLRKAGDSTAVISDPNVNGNTYTFLVSYTTKNTHDNLSIYPYSEQKNVGGDQPQVGGKADINFDIKFTDTWMNVVINDKDIMADTDTYSGKINQAGTTDLNSTNVLKFVPSFGCKAVTEFVINDVTYKEGMQEVKVVEDEVAGLKVKTVSITVPGADKYTIKGEADKDSKIEYTIIWANADANQNATDFKDDMLLTHGSAKIIAIYDENGNKVSGEIDVDSNGMGHVAVMPGSKVIFEFVPEYGYQLTSVKANGTALEPQNTINQYSYIMPETNIHFAAEFTKTDDTVKAHSEKVSSGNIELGNTLNGGSAQLTVNDIELTSDKVSGFEKAAGEYTISNYLNIDLYNVFYKGKNDSNDVWKDKIDELDKEATITLKLEDGITADDIVIVHNIHDGDEYEVIEIDSYDTDTNTITFRTKSFSNYAIATKTAKTTNTINTNNINNSTNTTNTDNDAETSSNPKTGDNIAIITTIFAISALGLVMTIKFNKSKRKINKN